MRAKFPARAALLCLLLVPSVALPAVSCTVAAGSVSFGSYDVFSAMPLTATGAVNVTCTAVGGPRRTTINLSVAISPSATSGSTANRQMAVTGQADRLAYNLYGDVSYTQPWGDQPGVDDYVTRLRIRRNTSMQVPLTIFGLIPAAQDVAAGIYTDSVIVTVMP